MIVLFNLFLSMDKIINADFQNCIPEKYKDNKIISYLLNLISFDTTKSETECMIYIQNVLKEEFWDNIIFEKQDIWDNWRYNLILSNTNNPEILLAWHIDVVPVDNKDQFKPYIEWEKLYWRWSVDMKWGVAVLMDLLPDLINNNKKFWMLFYCDEEYYFKWMKKFTEEYNWKITPKIVIIPEPTDNKLLLSFRWCVECDISIEWKSAHAARKWEWISAIEEMMIFYKALENYIKKKDSNKLWFESSVNLAYIAWWYKNDQWEIINRANMVSNISNATFDIRIWNDLTQLEFENFCKDYFNEREKVINKQWINKWVTLLKNDLKLRLWPLLQKDIEEKYKNNRDLNPWTTFWYSDIQLIKEQIWWECIQVGPWPNEKCHQSDEYVEIPSLFKTKNQIIDLLWLKTWN